MRNETTSTGPFGARVCADGVCVRSPSTRRRKVGGTDRSSTDHGGTDRSRADSGGHKGTAINPCADDGGARRDGVR